jgi:hypothetical protein
MNKKFRKNKFQIQEKRKENFNNKNYNNKFKTSHLKIKYPNNSKI